METKMTREETEKRLQTLAPAIAKALGPTWTVDTREEPLSHYARITDAARNDFAIAVMTTYSVGAGRIQIAGDLPSRDSKGKYVNPGKRPSITVSAEKDAAAIARDISRRLLPEYTEAHAKAAAAVAATNEYIDACETNAHRLARIVGATIREDRSGGGDAAMSFYIEGCYATVRGTSDGARIEGSFSMPQALAIMHALASLANAGSLDADAARARGIKPPRRGHVLVSCDGEAHSNPHIDNCTGCAPRWGWREVKIEK